MRLPLAALNSEPEVETALHLPGGAAITTPEHHPGAGVDAHGGVGEVVGGAVEAEFHQGTVVGIAVDAVAIGGSGFQEGHRSDPPGATLALVSRLSWLKC